MVPYLDAIVERLLKLLEPQYGKDGKVRSYVQEQAVTTLAMVADASEGAFAAHYGRIMPLLMNVLRNATGDVGEHRKLRWKASRQSTFTKRMYARDDTLLFDLLRVMVSASSSLEQLAVHTLFEPCLLHMPRSRP